MSNLGTFLPNYAEVFARSGIGGVIQGLRDEHAPNMGDREILEILIKDPTDDVQEMLNVSPDMLTFMNSELVQNVLRTTDPATLPAVLATLPGYTAGPAMDSLIQNVVMQLLPTEARAAVRTVTLLNQAFGIASAGTSPDSIVGHAVRSIHHTLTQIISNNAGPLLVGTSAIVLGKAISTIAEWWRNLDPEDKAKASPQIKTIVEQTEELRKFIKNAKLINKDVEMVGKLNKLINSGNITETARHLLNQNYEDHVLSVLRRQLQNTLTNPLPLYDFTSHALKSRATKPAGSRPSLYGYPSSVIGINL